MKSPAIPFQVDYSQADFKLAGDKCVRVIAPAPREIWRELMENDPEAIVPQ
jgi:hypothetical protein